MVSAEEARRAFDAPCRSLAACRARPVALAAALGRVLAERRGRADRRAAVRSLQRRRLCGARRRSRRRQRNAARRLVLNAEVIGVRPSAGRRGAPGTATSHRDRRRHSARRRRGGDDRDRPSLVEDGAATGDRPAPRRAPGQFISYAGSDIARGETLLRRGARIGSREIGMLAACGLAAIEVVRTAARRRALDRRRAGRRPGAPLKPAGVYDSNGAIIAAAVAEAGGEPVPFGAFPDDEVALELAMRTALEACDMVVLSGGTSKGAGDLSHRVVSRLGPPGILVHGVALKPGKPLCLAVGRRQAAGGAARLSDLGDLHLPCLRGAGHPRARRTAARGRADRRGARAGAHRLRTRPQGVRAGLAGRRASDGPIAFPTGKGSGAVTASRRPTDFWRSMRSPPRSMPAAAPR